MIQFLRLLALALVATAGLTTGSAAQTCPATNSEPSLTPGGSVFGRSASQWDAYFGAKADANNGILCNPTIVGTLVIPTDSNISFLGNARFQGSVQFDHGAVPAADITASLGAPSDRFLGANFKLWRSDNGAHSWLLDTGIGTTGDGNFTITHDGVTRATLSGTGSLALFDSKTGAITADGYALGAFSQNSGTATASFIWSCFLHATCDSTGAANYDGLRGVVVSPAGQTALLTNAVAGYIIESTGRSGPPYASFPVATALIGMGIADADGASVWGVNTLCTDNRGQTVSSHGPRFCFNEFDLNITSPATGGTGLMLAGASLVQPASAYGVALQTLDSANGTIAKWSAFLFSADGATNTFAAIGAQAASGSNVNSQNLTFNWRDGSGLGQNTSLAATPGGFITASTSGAGAAGFVLGTGGVFATGDTGGFDINSRIAVFGTAGTVSFGSDPGWSNVDLGNGTAPINLNGPVSIASLSLPGSFRIDANGLTFGEGGSPATPGNPFQIVNTYAGAPLSQAVGLFSRTDYQPTGNDSSNSAGAYGDIWIDAPYLFSGVSSGVKGNAYAIPQITATIASGGSGNVVGDILTAVGGTCSTQLNAPPQFTVTTAPGGVVTGVSFNKGFGACVVYPSNPVATTSSRGGAAPPHLTLAVAASPNTDSAIGAGLTGLYGRVRNQGGGTLANAYSVYADGAYNSANGAITNAYSVYMVQPYDTTNRPAHAWGLYAAGAFPDGMIAAANNIDINIVGSGSGRIMLEPGATGYEFLQFSSGLASPLSGSSNPTGIYTYMLSSGAAYVDSLTSGPSTTAMSFRVYVGGGVYKGITLQSGSGDLYTDQNIGAGALSSSTRITAQGAGATSASYALFAQNSTPATIFYARDDLLVFVDHLLTNGAIQLGGLTASFPMLKRSGTTLAARLADDSADAPISASMGTFSGAINKVAITPPASGATLTIADGKTLTDTSGIGASILLGATGGGFSAYAGASCTNQFPRSLSAAGAASCASVAIGSDVSGLAAGVAAFLATPSSANLASAITDETGSGALVFGTSPTIASPTISGTVAGAHTYSGALTLTSGPTINLNAAALPAALAGTTIQLGAADSVNNRISMESFAAVNTLLWRRANGTAASRSALASGDTIGSIVAFGATDTTNYSAASRGGLSVLTTEAWDATHQGTQINFTYTPTGGVATATGAILNGTGVALFKIFGTLEATVLGITTPTTWTNTQTCTVGQIMVDSGFIYVCAAPNVPKRVAISAF